MRPNAPQSTPGHGEAKSGSPLKRIALAAACVIVTAVSVYCIVRPSHPGPKVNPTDYRRPWVCEACSATFLELPATGMLRCPTCGKTKAVQSIVYVCAKCGGEFEAYRLRDYYASATGTDEDGHPVMPMAYYRKPDGDWTADLSHVAPAKCPKCGSEDRATLKEKQYGPVAR